MSVIVFVLTLDEIDGISEIMPKIKKEWADKIILVDGGSTDGTIEKAKELGFEVIHQKNKGEGNACRVGTDATDSYVAPPSYANPETIARFQQEKKEAQNRLLENSIREAANREPEPSYLAKANDYINSIIGKVDMEGGLVPPLALVEGVLPDTSSVGKLKDSIVNKGTQLKTKLKSLS